jgi:hypothetical protein
VVVCVAPRMFPLGVRRISVVTDELMSVRIRLEFGSEFSQKNEFW